MREGLEDPNYGGVEACLMTSLLSYVPSIMIYQNKPKSKAAKKLNINYFINVTGCLSVSMDLDNH